MFNVSCVKENEAVTTSSVSHVCTLLVIEAALFTTCCHYMFNFMRFSILNRLFLLVISRPGLLQAL